MNIPVTAGILIRENMQVTEVNFYVVLLWKRGKSLLEKLLHLKYAGYNRYSRFSPIRKTDTCHINEPVSNPVVKNLIGENERDEEMSS